jgi:hypothetical protein
METPPKSEIILYQTEDGRARIECRFEGESIWLTQKLMAGLFQKDVRTINEHIQNVFEEGELPQDSVIRKFRITAADGKTYETQHYNLDVGSNGGFLPNVATPHLIVGNDVRSLILKNPQSAFQIPHWQLVAPTRRGEDLRRRKSDEGGRELFS